MSDRGMKKWAPYKSLKEQWTTLDNNYAESEKIEKPKISNEIAEEINEILVNYHQQELIVTYYKNGRIIKQKSVIEKIDASNRRIVIEDRKIINFTDLLYLENVD